VFLTLPDMLSLWPPTEVAEGYQYETVRENHTLSDGTRTMRISYVQPLAHAEGISPPSRLFTGGWCPGQIS
jgi:hypothetical protein